jgi:hypothetical protein
MSDLRFARELGAEFNRLQGAGARPMARGLAGHAGVLAAVAVPVVIAIVAVALLGARSHTGGRQTAAGGSSASGTAAALAFSGGKCRPPAPGSRSVTIGVPPGMGGRVIRLAGGTVAGTSWELRGPSGVEAGQSIAEGSLTVGGRRYPLCERSSLPLALGVIDAGSREIVYGYVPKGGAGDRITLTPGDVRTKTVETGPFFIAALPRPACTYRAVTATAEGFLTGSLSPAIDRSLNSDRPRFVTTVKLGACQSNQPVAITSAHGFTRGRSPNAPLAIITGQATLRSGGAGPTHAVGNADELSHEGLLGLQVYGYRLTPGRYAIWLTGSRPAIRVTSSAVVGHGSLKGSYDLPAGAGANRRILVTLPGSTPGAVVLSGTLVRQH